jgi:hypothetical protein
MTTTLHLFLPLPVHTRAPSGYDGNFAYIMYACTMVANFSITGTLWQIGAVTVERYALHMGCSVLAQIHLLVCGVGRKEC